ncbi:probable ubiquitin-like-specific protease 2A isoform X2 [Cicer arietinum]|uniref:Probable ubiquitin-like-specific protease 2B isoform X2 n=1 Tax=Cicer arietinum TaxID=3827 RepID=A0A1S3DZV2_CICAR|nr:probable ubiquitin-like-specific protease 2B isoform X2 [Cicer arietinum]
MTQRTSSSSINKFDVFEFNEEEEKVSSKMFSKFTNPNKPRSSPISKYDFLQAFAQSSKPPSKSVPVDPIDLDDEQDDEEETKCSQEKVFNKRLEIDDDEDDDTGIDNHGKNGNACLMDSPLQHVADKAITGYAECIDSDFDLKNQSLDMLSDDDDDSSEMSSSSKFEDCFEDQLVADDSAAFKINDIEKVVDVFPDFIQYEELYCTSSRLIFSCSSLKLEGPTNNQAGKTFKIEWETEDIIKIESCWFEKIETALISLLLRSKDSGEVGITNEKPGFKLLKFAVYDSYWSSAEEAIKLLDMRYTDIWSTFFVTDTDNYGNNSALGQGSLFSQRHYFPIFGEAFDEVIYPKGEPDAVSISKRDVALLQPETFINDTIIDFYIKYLKNKLTTDEQERFHFFNSFFFRKLADLDKDPSSASDGRAAFQRVRKWTRKVNLFEKDYIVIPINYSLHWSLIVICHPGEVPCFRDEEIKETSKVPCILHMDSLKGSHKGLKSVFQSYLCEEWKERHSNMVDDFSSKFLQLRFISLELPQQENLYDCGLFLLHYVERFLEEAPIKFNPFNITKFSDFLSSNWFPPAEASLKRSYIENLIYDIFENSSLQAPACHGKGPLPEVPCLIKHKVDAGSSGACCYPAMCHGNPSNCSTETDIQFPTAFPIRVTSCLRDHGTVYKDLQTAAVSPHSDCLKMSVCHRRRFMSPIKETEEFGEEVAISIVRENSQVGIVASDFPSTSYIGIDHRAPETTQQGLSMNFVESVEGLSCSRTSTSVSWNTLDSGTLEDQPLEKIEESNSPNKMSLEELAASVVQDSQESNDGHETDACVKSRSSFQENINSVIHQISDLAHNTGDEDDSIVSQKEPLASESQEQDAKRPKFMNESGGSSRRFTRRMLKETCLMS